MYDFLPPRIKHDVYRPKAYREMVRDAACNLRLSKAETSLLCYYADCANGFRPARAEITKRTGIKSGSISRARLGLARRGIILYDDKENRVILFGERIRAFAMLEKPFTKEEAVHGTYGFPRESHRRPPTVGELANAYRDRDAPNWEIAPYLRIRWPSRPLTEREKAFNQFIGLLTEQQFIALFYTAAPGSLPSSVSLQQLPPAQPADDCPDPADSVFYDPEDEPWDDEPREDEPWEGEPWDDELPGSLASSAS